MAEKETIMRHIVILAFWLTIGAGCRKEIDPDCIEKSYDGRACTFIYQPVCGCNGKTYGNACIAASVGISIVKQGECGK